MILIMIRCPFDTVNVWVCVPERHSLSFPLMILFRSRSQASVIGPLPVTPIRYLMFTSARLVATSNDIFTVFCPSHWIGAVTKEPLLLLLVPAGTCN